MVFDKSSPASFVRSAVVSVVTGIVADGVPNSTIFVVIFLVVRFQLGSASYFPFVPYGTRNVICIPPISKNVLSPSLSGFSIKHTISFKFLLPEVTNDSPIDFTDAGIITERKAICLLESSEPVPNIDPPSVSTPSGNTNSSNASV